MDPRNNLPYNWRINQSPKSHYKLANRYLRTAKVGGSLKTRKPGRDVEGVGGGELATRPSQCQISDWQLVLFVSSATNRSSVDAHRLTRVPT